MAEGKGAGESLLAGAAGGGVVALADWLRARVTAAPEGEVISLDEWTRETLLAMLSALGELGSRLDAQTRLLGELAGVISGGESLGPISQLEITTIEPVSIPAQTPRILHLADAPEKGVVLSIELVSDSPDVRYDIHLDDVVWSFNVADMTARSIEYPRFPGGWIALATGSVFVFMFSGGAASEVRYRTNFSLEARAISANPVAIAGGELVRKVYEQAG